MTRRFDLTVRDLGSGMILYDESSETYHVLNDTARQIWDLLDGTRTAAGVEAAFFDLYPQVDKERLEKDLMRTMAEFNRMGLMANPAAAAM